MEIYCQVCLNFFSNNRIKSMNLLFLEFHSIEDFPKVCQVFSTDNITTRGPGLSQALLGAHTWFAVEAPPGSASDIEIIVQTPHNEQIQPTTRLTPDGLRVDWTPNEVGTYVIHVTYAGNTVPGSPFRVKCYDPRKVVITPPTSDGSVQKPVRFLSKPKDTNEVRFEILFVCLDSSLKLISLDMFA